MRSTPEESGSSRLFIYFSYVVRACAVAQAVLIGLFFAYNAFTLLSSLISELSWRQPKGFLVWEIHVATGAFVVAAAMVSMVCFTLAYAVFRWHVSRRMRLWIVGVILAGFMAFVVGTGIFVTTFPASGDF